MLATANTFTLDGPQARWVTVELDVRTGLPAFTIVGLADAAVREARERIAAAIRNSGFELPPRRITANLAPADLPKAGPGLDLALACALLSATGQLCGERLATTALFGELALDGRLRPARGSLAVARAARGLGLKRLVLPVESAREAGLIEGLTVAPVGSLAAAARVLAGGACDPMPPPSRPPARPPLPELGDVRGREQAIRTMIVAGAGGHNLLLSGPPGTGKTMLAQRLPSILPALSRDEAVEVALLHGLLGAEPQLSRRPPFRAPHHTTTAAGLLGDARGERLGEVVLAHRGVLFLDELSEFSRSSLEALRQPLEEGRVAISRARHEAVHPARFMLIAATNPCPCGYAGPSGRCRCGQGDLARHARRLSGPLLDRIDLCVSLDAPARAASGQDRRTSSAAARARVTDARERQAKRLRGEAIALNAHMDNRSLARHVRLDARGEQVLSEILDRGLLSARGEQRLLRVARTLADLAGRERVRGDDLAGALALRCDVGRGLDTAP